MQAPNPTLGDLVRLAFGDVQIPPLAVSIPEFLTGRLTQWTDVESCLNAVGVHAAFDPAAIARELQPIFPELMDVQVGRYEDLVVVASIPFWTHQEIGWSGDEEMGRRLDRSERDALARKIATAIQRTSGGVGSLVDDGLEDAPAVIEVSGHWAFDEAAT